jgi:hypothetical protein
LGNEVAVFPGEPGRALASGRAFTFAGSDIVVDLFGKHSGSSGLTVDDDARGVDGRVRFAGRCYYTIAAALDRTQINEQDLIVAMVDYFAEGVAAADEIGRRELAFKDGILEMIAEIAHGLIHGAQPLVVTDVVANEIRIAHDPSSYPEGGMKSPRPKWLE